MKAVAISFVLFLLQCLLLPADCAVYGKKNVSTPAKIPNTCLPGPPGLPGRNGINGRNGLQGRNGVNGHNGSPGPYGPAGAKGEKGVAGSPGSLGVKGDAGQNGTDAEHRNWKQCAWKENNGLDIGLIKDCVFNKKKDDTFLRVVYQGNILVGNCGGCCKRWFISFNGAECSGPLPIDATIWIANAGENNHRPGAIEGYCNNIHKGKIRVGINIGNCPGYGDANGYTGWTSVSRLMIEEVPRSQ
ncbi:collagen triple helix repeat-containing protein 1-like isoform X1 [Oculina patagonica]